MQSVLEEALTLTIGRRALLALLALLSTLSLLQLPGTTRITDALNLQHLCSIKEPHGGESLPVRLTDRNPNRGHIERLHQRLRGSVHHKNETAICSHHNTGGALDPTLNKGARCFPCLKGC